MALGTRGKSRFCIIVLSLFLMTAIIQILPGPISYTQDGSASSTWTEASGNDFSNGDCNLVDIEGSGSGAYLTLQSGQIKEILTSYTEDYWTYDYCAFNTDDEDSRTQSVYLASELTAAGFKAGNILKIHLRCYQSPGRPNLKNFRIRLQNTASSTSTFWVTSGWTLVYGPTDVLPTAGNWYEFQLTTPFYWDGTSNLLVDLSRDDNGWSYGGGLYIRGYFSNYRTFAGSDRYSNYAWPFDNMYGNDYNFVPSIKFTTKTEKGEYTSKIYHPSAPVEWESLSWNAVKPPDSEVKFQLRSSVNEYDIYNEEFIGPDGTSLSFYTTSGTDINSIHKTDQFIQYKVFLTNNNPTNVPKVHDVTISFNYLPNPPILDQPTSESWVKTNKPTFSWVFSDIDSLGQSGFQWQADEDDDFGSVNFDSGEIASTESHYTPSFPISDGTYYWRVRTKDSDGSWGLYGIQGTVKIDSTVSAPKGLVVTPSEWTNKNMFTVDWTNPTDYSGLKAGAYYYVGKEPPTSQYDGTWSSNKPISITHAPNGENNIYVWLEDNVGNRNCSIYGVAKLKLDLTAPDPPTGFRVKPENWTSISEFSLDWTNPSDHSGLKIGAYYYIRTNPPGSQANGIWMTRKPFTITKVPEGVNNVYLWLDDSLGNSNFLNYSIGELKLDTKPPVIDHLPITSGLHGRQIKITVKVTDESSGVDEVLLYFKRPTDLTYAVVPMENTEPFYSATIPGSSVTNIGLEYYIKAMDNSIPANINYFGINSETQYEPTSLTDIDIKVSSLPAVEDYSPKGYKVPVDNNVTIIFNKSMNMISTESAISISPYLDGVFSWGTNGDMLIFDPSAPMKYNTSHSITISRNAKDSDDNYFASEFQWSFSTQTEPNKDDEKPDDTSTASESKSSDDNSMMFSLLTFGVIIIIVLILVILAIFSKLNPKKKTEGEDESTAILAPTQENPQTPTNMQPQQNVYVAGSPVGGMGIPPPATNTVGQTPMPMPMPAVSIAPGTLPSPTMPNQATGPAQVPMLTPAQNTAPTMGGVTYRCPNCTANILDQNNCPYCGWTRM